MSPEEKVWDSKIWAFWGPRGMTYPSNPPVAELGIEYFSHTQTKMKRCTIFLWEEFCCPLSEKTLLNGFFHFGRRVLSTLWNKPFSALILSNKGKIYSSNVTQPSTDVFSTKMKGFITLSCISPNKTFTLGESQWYSMNSWGGCEPHQQLCQFTNVTVQAANSCDRNTEWKFSTLF